ncbi:MAG: hypothetical protein ACJ703_09635 [Nitrososphaera sp.]
MSELVEEKREGGEGEDDDDDDGDDDGPGYRFMILWTYKQYKFTY